MRKSLLFLIFTTLLITLCGCNSENDDTAPGIEARIYQTMEQISSSEEIIEKLDFSYLITIVDREVLHELEHFHIIDYAELRGTFITEGITLLLTFNEPIYNLQLLDVEFIGINDLTFGVKSELFQLEMIEEYTPLILSNYFGLVTLNRTGIYFETQSGEKTWATLEQNSFSGEISLQPFNWSKEYSFDELVNLNIFHWEDDAEFIEIGIELFDYHLVSQGETLFSISRLYSTDVDTLMIINNLEDTEIMLGQLIKIPVGSHIRRATEEFGFTLEILDSEFELYINFPVIEIFSDHDALDLLFSFNRPVFNFRFVDVIFTDIFDDYRFAVTRLWDEVGDIAVSERGPSQILLKGYHGIGTFPSTGFYFSDEDGNEYWFTFQQSMRDGLMHFIPFTWSSSYDLYDPFN